MDKRHILLTNEDIKKKYVNQFALVADAIKLVTQMIDTGRGPRIVTDNGNPAVIILEEIRQGKDILDDVITLKNVEPVNPSKASNSSAPSRIRSSEKKKPRRILV